MNERIKELLIEAHKQIDGGIYNAHLSAWTEKFAELIIKECIRVPYNMWDKAELNADIAVKIENRIKERFGVEE